MSTIPQPMIPHREQSTLLFLCTGNYYRSRFAEVLFNVRAEQARLSWVAESRGLALERGSANSGPISPYALAGLRSRGVRIAPAWRYPLQLQKHELARADMIIALSASEHRALLAERFPGWMQRVEFWEVHDMHLVTAEDALAAIDREVTQLLGRLS